MAKKIKLNKDKEAIVDDEDYEYLNQWKWFTDSNGYARRTKRVGPRKESKCIAIIMHRLLMNNPINKEVDHINNNRLDNRKCNLRLASDLENARNVSKRKNCTSKYKGVCWHKATKKWLARLGINRTKIVIGYFDSETEAAKAYNKKALEIYGEFAKLNEIP